MPDIRVNNSLPTLTPELLITAYESGYFPMAEGRDCDELHWFSPDPRAIIPLGAFHLSRSLRKAIRQRPYRVTLNRSFPEVMQACAAPRGADRDSWINPAILDAYGELHDLGHAHSVECWADDTLAGGLYGVSLGGAFFGESMFSHRVDGSKIAFAYLLEILLRCGYTLLDTQFVNAHLLQFGVEEIPRRSYLALLNKALIASPSPSHQFLTLGGIIAASDPADFTVMRPESASRTTA
jgi:leucyl/phenylalanyl-tRNA---protein transferase